MFGDLSGVYRSMKFSRARDDGPRTRSHESGQFNFRAKPRLFHSAVFCAITPSQRDSSDSDWQGGLKRRQSFSSRPRDSSANRVVCHLPEWLIHAEHGNTSITYIQEHGRRRTTLRLSRYGRSVCQTSCRSYSHKLMNDIHRVCVCVLQ